MFIKIKYPGFGGVLENNPEREAGVNSQVVIYLPCTIFVKTCQHPDITLIFDLSATYTSYPDLLLFLRLILKIPDDGLHEGHIP